MVGLCNGFQIMVNLGLVPATNTLGIREAALMPNNTTRYQCRWITLKRQSEKCIWTRGIETIHVPIAHGEGNFYCEADTLTTLKDNDQIAFTYIKEDGKPANGEFPFNPNGALEDIAGICDPTGRIFGMMPHPERAADSELRNTDGRIIFESILGMIQV